MSEKQFVEEVAGLGHCLLVACFDCRHREIELDPDGVHSEEVCYCPVFDQFRAVHLERACSEFECYQRPVAPLRKV